MNPYLLATIISSAAGLLPWIFGGNDEGGFDEEAAQEAQDVLENMGLNAPYQSPILEGLDPVVANAVLQNYGRYANWGFPEGMQMDTGFMDNLLQQLTSGGSLNPGQQDKTINILSPESLGG